MSVPLLIEANKAACLSPSPGADPLWSSATGGGGTGGGGGPGGGGGAAPLPPPVPTSVAASTPYNLNLDTVRNKLKISKKQTFQLLSLAAKYYGPYCGHSLNHEEI